MDYFHVDGFRIDAGHLFYHLGNKQNGLNMDAINFQNKHPIISLVKIDSFSQQKIQPILHVTHPVDIGGVGFNYKWNIGYMNDTLKYFKLDQFIINTTTTI